MRESTAVSDQYGGSFVTLGLISFSTIPEGEHTCALLYLISPTGIEPGTNKSRSVDGMNVSALPFFK